MGLVTEAGELADMLKKHIFYGRNIDKVNAQEEIGDTCWYVGVAIDVLKTTMNDIMTKNIEKLRKRYPEKFTEEKANNRNIDNEMSHF
jgi:NTP pyrophosphatase (non-canonical NTP hydrolase)